MNIILCGLPFCGKTTVGKMLAAQLNRPFLDTDLLLEQAYASTTGTPQTCRQIALKHGLPYFRTLEMLQIESLKNIQNSVISLGGGALSHTENREILKSIGYILYLKASPEIIWNRIRESGSIPSYLDATAPEKSFLVLAEARIPTFEATAHICVQTDGLSPHEIMDNILCLSDSQNWHLSHV